MATIKEYMESRVRPRVAWYDRRAVLYKRLHLTLQYFAAIASIILVMLIHVEAVSRLLLAILAALVSIAVVSERIGQFGRLWQLYRLMAEALNSEEQLYVHGVGAYAAAAGGANGLFVQRVEHLLSAEASRWETVALEGKTAAQESHS